MKRRKTNNSAPEWRRDEENGSLGLFVTKGGLIALGVDETETTKPSQAAGSMPRQRKTVVAKLRGKERKVSPPTQGQSSTYSKQARSW